MCTVSIFPIGENDFILTSNRDEAPNRISLPPQQYAVDSIQMLFPKDKLAGGTWIGISEIKRVICLLNGGFEKHNRASSYRQSRGVVVKDLMASEEISKAVDDYDLNGVEPFTLVIADWIFKLKFFELVWDGHKKYFKELPLEPHVWSSSTLYTKTMQEARDDWFRTFISQKKVNATSLLNFHKTAGKGNLDYGVIMDRGFVKTTSITQVEKTSIKIEMRHTNLNNGETHKKSFDLFQSVDD